MSLPAQELTMLRKFLQDDRGATAIEYGLIAALIFLGCVAAIGSYGESMSAMYSKIRNAIVKVDSGA